MADCQEKGALVVMEIRGSEDWQKGSISASLSLLGDLGLTTCLL